MASLLRDVFDGLKTYWESKLPMAEVRLGFIPVTTDDEDQADSGEPAHDYPSVTLTLLNPRIASERKYGGVDIRWEQDPANADRMIGKRKPIPITLNFQLDTWADKRDDDWTMNEIIMRIFGGGRAKFTTADGRELYLAYETTDGLDDLNGDSIWRKSYRFNIEAWIEDTNEALEAYKVLIRHFDIDGQPHIIDSRS